MAVVRLLITSLVLLLVPQGVPGPETRPTLVDPVAYPESIVLTSAANGRVGPSWEIDAQGDGEFLLPDLRGGGGDYALEVRRFHAGPEAFARVRDTLGPIAQYIQGGVPCRQLSITLPSGEVRWTAGGSRATLPYSLGCWSEEARRAYVILDTATHIVMPFAAAAPVAERRPGPHLAQ
jgi:hypothetical protein